jgi:hypothetical protein
MNPNFFCAEKNLTRPKPSPEAGYFAVSTLWQIQIVIIQYVAHPMISIVTRSQFTIFQQTLLKLRHRNTRRCMTAQDPQLGHFVQVQSRIIVKEQHVGIRASRGVPECGKMLLFTARVNLHVVKQVSNGGHVVVTGRRSSSRLFRPLYLLCDWQCEFVLQWTVTVVVLF